MNNKERAAIILYKYLSVSPDIVCAYRGTGEAICFEVFSSITSHIREFEREIIAFRSGQSRKGDFIIKALRILHNIKGKADMMEVAEISNVCHLAGVQLSGDCQVVPINTLLSVKDWLMESVRQLKSGGDGLYEYFFNAECLEIVCTVEIKLLDMCMGGAPSEHDIKDVSNSMRQIVELARRGERNDVKVLAETVLELLGDFRVGGRVIVSSVNKEKIFDLLDAMKERVLDVDRFGVKSLAKELSLPDSS